jgi:hypothetical protein
MADDTLLRDCRRFLKATEKLFTVLPPERMTQHLAATATGLVARIDAATPHTETED